MAKVTLPNISSGFASTTQLNTALDTIEAELNNKVLYRNPPSGEPNQLEADIDANDNTLYNVRNATNVSEVVNLGQMQNYVAAASSGLISVAHDTVVATEDQTVVTFTGVTYTLGVNNLAVFVNGSRQRVGVNYNETTSNSITFVAGLNENDVVDVYTNEALTSTVTDAGAVNYDPAGTGAVSTTVESKLREFVSVKDFGAVGDGVADDTAAIQAALDSGQPSYAPPGEYLITDTLLLDPGAALVGAGGVANYAEAATKIRFEPPTKRDVFNWRTAPIGYVFAGLKLKGFTIRGFGAGASACLDVPLLYNGDLDFFAFAGIDVFARVEKWMDTNFHGGAQGFSAFGVEFKNTSGGSSDVTTTSNFDLYLSQGPTGYVFQNYGVSGINIKGVVESVDCVFDMARGNVVSADIYTENAPRTDAGAAFKVGKTGSAPASATSLMLNLNPGIGFSTGSLPANCLLLDADVARFVKISGYAYRYGALLATTANTQRVVLSNLDTDNCPWLSLAGGIADMSAITATGFRPRTMQTRGDNFFSEYNLASPDLELIGRPRSTVTRRKLFVDSEFSNKLIRRDGSGNFTNPIEMLRTTVTSGWTFNGARLVPGELVAHDSTLSGQVALWRSQRHTKDTASSYAACSTVSGSAVLTRAGSFSPIDVGDWVTVSAGFPSATTQYRVVARAADYSTITVDTNATSTVSGTVTVATEAHQLVPVAAQGFRQAATQPVGIVTPYFVGQEYLDTATNNWWKAHGLTSADWKQIT